MKERTLKILRYLAVPCVFGCLTLSADESDDSNGMKGSCKKSCHESKPSCAEINGSQENGHFVSTYDRIRCKEITPNAGPVVSGGVEAYVEADYIYWHASQGELEYATSNGLLGLGTAATSNNVLGQGTTVLPHFKMSSGFKAGLGLDFQYDGWDMGVMYTWLRPHASSSFGPSNAGVINRALIPANPSLIASGASDALLTTTDPTSGSADWRLHFNVLDLELGRAFFISPRLVLRPHCGLKGTWDTQHFNVTYVKTGGTLLALSSTGSVTVTNSTNTETYQITQKQNSWGLGPRTGMNLNWLITRNFSFFGNWAVTALWGQFKDTRFDTSNITTSAGASVVANNTTLNFRERVHQITPVLEMELGLAYDYWFCDDDYRFRLAASWENQLWFNQNHFLTGAASTAAGDLTLQGLTVNVRFDF